MGDFLSGPLRTAVDLLGTKNRTTNRRVTVEEWNDTLIAAIQSIDDFDVEPALPADNPFLARFLQSVNGVRSWVEAPSIPDARFPDGTMIGQMYRSYQNGPAPTDIGWQLFSPANDGDVLMLAAGSPEWAALSLQSIVTPVDGGLLLGSDLGGGSWVVLNPSATEGDVLTIVGGVPGWVAPAGGGGYDKLTASGANGGTFTFYDDTLATGLTKVYVRAGAAHGYGEALIELMSSGGGSLTSNYGMVALYGGEVHMNAHVYNDANGHDGFELRGSGLGLHATSGISWSSSGSQYGSKDFGIFRAGANAGKVTNGGAGFSQWRCQSLAVNNSVAATTLGTVIGAVELFDTAGASIGKVALYDNIT